MSLLYLVLDVHLQRLPCRRIFRPLIVVHTVFLRVRYPEKCPQIPGYCVTKYPT